MDEAFAMFVLKPVEIRCTDNVNYFLYTEALLMSEGVKSVSVPFSSVSSCKASLGTIQHLQCLGQYSLMLPAPPDLSEWEGFNTNISEYFNLYHAFKHSKVPGTGPERIPQCSMIFPEDYYWHLCLPFKVFAWSLITCAGNTFKKKTCYMDIKEENIFLRGKTVKILGVGLIDYTLEKAISNLNDVGLLIERLLEKMGLEYDNFPADLKKVLWLLQRNPFENNQILEENPVADYDLIRNFICWMAGEERNHAIDDLAQDFLYQMGHFYQLDVGSGFPNFTDWVELFQQKNFLLRIVSIHNLPKNKTQQEMEVWYQRRRNLQLECVNNNKHLADQLHSIREYFISIHNAVKHLLETAHQKCGIKLEPDEVDLVASSQFSATYAQVQISVLKALIGDQNELGSYRRFARYFPSDDDIRFEPKDRNKVLVAWVWDKQSWAYVIKEEVMLPSLSLFVLLSPAVHAYHLHRSTVPQHCNMP